MNNILTENHNNKHNMKNKMTTLIAASVATVSVLLVGSAQANEITGSIAFGGTATLNNVPAAATQVSTWAPDAVSDATGSFASAIGDTPTFLTPWVFATLPATGLWKVGTFSFDLTGIDGTSTLGGGLLISGTGWVSSTDVTLSGTAGTFYFDAEPNGGGDTFTFDAGTSAPDGGLTVALLGGGLVGLGALRRKLS
jgi:hypothetical protein